MNVGLIRISYLVMFSYWRYTSIQHKSQQKLILQTSYHTLLTQLSVLYFLTINISVFLFILILKKLPTALLGFQNIERILSLQKKGEKILQDCKKLGTNVFSFLSVILTECFCPYDFLMFIIYRFLRDESILELSILRQSHF